MHRDSLVHYCVHYILATRKNHGMSASFREREVDGLGEVKRYSRGVSEIYDEQKLSQSRVAQVPFHSVIFAASTRFTSP